MLFKQKFQPPRLFAGVGVEWGGEGAVLLIWRETLPGLVGHGSQDKLGAPCWPKDGLSTTFPVRSAWLQLNVAVSLGCREVADLLMVVDSAAPT